MSVVTSRPIVPPAMSILDEMGPSSSSGVAMKKGSFVMANYRGEGSFNAGRIESYDAANNTYSIKYEDGVMEFGVSEKNIQEQRQIEFPWILQCHHRIFYGGEKYTESYRKQSEIPYFDQLRRWTMPILWVCIATICLIYYYVKVLDFSSMGTYRTIVITGMYAECTVNYVFAARFLQISDLHMVLRTLPQESRQRKYLVYLQLIWFFSFVLGILFTLLDSTLYEEFNTAILLKDLFISLVGYFNTFYICGIWNWSVFIRYDVYNEEIYPKLDKDLKEYKRLFKDFCMRVESRTLLWKFNHSVRIITGLVIAIGYTQMVYYYDSPLEVASPCFFMICYYMSIWGTVYCAAYVNDSILSKTLDVLSIIVWEKDEERDVATDLITTVSIF